MIKEVLWSVDAFQKNTKIWNHSVRILNSIAAQTGARIEPVYVSSPSELRWAEGFAFPGTKQLHAAADKVLRKKLSKVKESHWENFHIVVDPKAFSMTAAAQALNKYALKTGSDLIVVGKQSKSGVERFFLGSYAETLLLHSQIPVLVVPAEGESRRPFQKILFATDLSAESLKAFKKLLQWAAPLKAQVILCHIIEDSAFYGSSMGGFMIAEEIALLDQAMKMQIKRAHQKLKSWSSLARKFQVPCQIISKKSLQSASREILSIAKKQRASCLAVATQSGALKAKLGSVARDIIRRAHLPVWVYPRRA